MSFIDDAVLLKMAEAEILREAERASARHAVLGVSGWKQCSKPNKTFLTNTLLQTMASNRILARKKETKAGTGKKSERKLLKKSNVEKGANFVYKRPSHSKDKIVVNTSSSKSKMKKSEPECTPSQTSKETKQQKVKLKTVQHV